MKTIHTFFCLGALLILCWQCAGPEPKARPWQSFIPEGYTLRDSVRGDLNLDSIPDFLLVLDSIAPAEVAPRRPVLLLYGVADGKFELADSSSTLLYDVHSGGVSGVEPYAGTSIDKGRFTIEQEGGMTHFRWNLLLRFALDSAEGNWYLDRTKYTTFNPEDTVPMRVTEKVVVRDSNDFGKVLLNDFDINAFESDEQDTSDTDDRFIDFNFFKMRKLVLPAKNESVDSIAVLRALFPGRFFRDYESMEDANVVFWVCDNCPKVKLDWYGWDDGVPEETEFPSSFANFTEAPRTLSYVENGEQHKAVFFSTGFDYPGSGRTTPGILGIAIFKKMSEAWHLVSFSPHVVAEGTFQTAHAPKTLLTAGNQTFFVLDGGNANGAGSWVNYYDKYIFGVKNGVPKTLFYEPAGTCQVYDSLMTQWKTVVTAPDGKKEFPDLLMITTGHFDRSSEEEYNWNEIPWLKKLLRQHPGQDSFDFKVERRFWFNGKKYVPAL